MGLSNQIAAYWGEVFDSAIPILEYKIFFKISNDQTILLPELCDGADQIVIKNMNCSVDMKVFLDAPFYFQIYDVVLIQVQARNKLGWSSLTPKTTYGGQVKSYP